MKFYKDTEKNYWLGDKILPSTPYADYTAFYAATSGFFNIANGEDVTLHPASKPVELNVTSGLVQGHSVIDKFGINPTIETSTDPEDIWEYGGIYPYDTFGTAPIQYISSSAVEDAGQTLEVKGLDIDGNDITQVITTTGRVNVVLPTPLWRIYRIANESAEGNDIVGTLYCHTDPAPTLGVPLTTAIRAIISNGDNQTQMALYTIPLGKVGFLHRGEFGISLEGNAGALAEFAVIRYMSRRVGKVFTTKKTITCMAGGGSAVYQDDRSFPDVIPALVDLKLNVQEVSTTMGVWAAFDILLVDEDQLSTSYLQALGQPGY